MPRGQVGYTVSEKTVWRLKGSRNSGGGDKESVGKVGTGR